MNRLFAIAHCALLLLSLPVFAEEIPITRVLAIGPVARGGRALAHRDPIEAQIVKGEWRAPKAGESAGGATWTELQAGNDGWFRGRALTGGYASAYVPSDRSRIMLLEAAGHGMVYVNGVPRAGDPYSYGYLRLPVELKKGENNLLFATGRGQLRAKLIDPAAPVSLDASDSTLPDLRLGEKVKTWGAVVVINASPETLKGAAIEARLAGGRTLRTAIPAILPFGVRKVGFRLEGAAASMPRPQNSSLEGAALSAPRPLASSEREAHLRIVGVQTGQPALKVRLRVRPPGATYKRTFISKIDGSVQYYAVNPASSARNPKSKIQTPKSKALVLTLHGASVEAIGQADSYAPKSWAHIVAPTNRRPYGFDWEEWGRLDALEVLEHAQKELGTDPQRTYLTGHSMGGHGTWQIGVQNPDRFAAIAPSAGWISFLSYAGGSRIEKPDPIEAILQRSGNASDTLALSGNYANQGVYILHGDADDNVPVREARTMAKRLGEFHRDWAIHEQKGAGHWWSVGDEPGAQCVDWPPIFDLFARRRLPDPAEVREVRFSTANPEVASRCFWATIEAQTKPLEVSSVNLRYDPIQRRFSGTTVNVERMTLDFAHVTSGPVKVEMDGVKLEAVGPPAVTRISMERSGSKWRDLWDSHVRPARTPARYGTFKAAFNHRVLFVYGTKGTAEENDWALAKARYDAETFGYRGNGSVDVLPDTEFDPKKTRDRSVIIYGNADTNAAWPVLLGDSPVQARGGIVTIGNREIKGDNLACLFVRPRKESDTACVAAVSGAGLAGMRLTDRIPIFLSGVGIPDCLVLSPTSLTEGSRGVLAAGFFGNDWSVGADFAFR